METIIGINFPEHYTFQRLVSRHDEWEKTQDFQFNLQFTDYSNLSLVLTDVAEYYTRTKQ